MASYTHEYSSFPTGLYTVNNFLDLKDAPNDVATLVMQIKDYILNGNFTMASSVLEENKDTLKRYIIDATYINKLDEELRNLEIYTRTKKQGLYYQASEPDCVLGDVWIA